MCQPVYLTSKRFTQPACEFKNLLADELRKRKIDVQVDSSYDVLNFWKRHKTFGIAIAFDFYKDNESGSGLTLNKNCSAISREFAYNLSNAYDALTPIIRWRDFQFVNSYDKEWFKFFNKVSAQTKAIFYLCTLTNIPEQEEFYVVEEDAVQLFADEIVRCLRSNFQVEEYRKKVRVAKLKKRRIS